MYHHNVAKIRFHLLWIVAAVCSLLLAGCSGDDGGRGPEGSAGPPGPPGPPGPSGAVAIGNATVITSEITSVTVPAAGAPVVNFQLTDELGRALKGLTPGSLRFVAARLAPGSNGGSSQWLAYTTITEQPGSGPGTTPQRQAAAEVATAGQFVDNGDGTYRYTFAKNITNDANLPYDATLTHRIGLEVRGLAPTNNATYTWQPSSGATTDIFSREVVSNATCNACHDQLAFHGGARFDLKYCVACHNPGSTDAQSGNTVDMKAMIHKIHMGEHLPSVEAGGSYGIYGFGGNFIDYSAVVFPQDLRNCTTCHRDSDSNTPQASNYKSVVNAETCGSCHDDVNFTTGQGHSAANIAASNADCLTCHGPDSTIDNGQLRVQFVHRIPTMVAAEKFKYSVVSATNTAPGQMPLVTIKVTDPTNGDAAYDIRTAGGPFQVGNSSLRVDLAWTTQDFHNIGSGSAPNPTTGAPNQPLTIDFKTGATANADGTFSKAATVALPGTLTGSGSALLEGRPNVDADGDGVLDVLSVAASGLTFAITDASPRPRRQVVNIDRCDDCHKVLSLHGSNRTDNTELCATCHNPNATDISRRGAASGACATGTSDAPIDFKHMVHAIHASGATSTPVTICGFGNSVNTFDFTYPGKLNNCEGCHNPNTYYPVDPTLVQGTTIHTGADRTLLTDDTVISPNSAVCSGCHVDATSRQHMIQNGGDFNATKAATGALVSGGVETCGLCHGPGRSADVKVMHDVARFQSN